MSSSDFVELPRLGLAFVRKQRDGRTLFYCDKHADLFISDTQTERVAELLKGAGATILLENDIGELFMLQSATSLPTRPCVGRSPLPSEVVYEHGDERWLRALRNSARYYVHAVHVSQTYCTPPTLAASLHLLLERFARRDYRRAVRQALSCVADAPMRRAERTLWQALGRFNDDSHPNAHALRLRLAAVGSAVRHWQLLPFSLSAELASYARCHERVDAALRLSLAEELDLLSEAFDPSQVRRVFGWDALTPQRSRQFRRKTVGCCEAGRCFWREWCPVEKTRQVGRSLSSVVSQRAFHASAFAPLELTVTLPPGAKYQRYDFDAIDDRSCLSATSKLSLKNRAFLQVSKLLKLQDIVLSFSLVSIVHSST